MTESNEETLSFEQALEQLEGIVEQLEKEDVPLEKAIDFYQKGMKLSALCDEKLKDAQTKMTEIMNEDDESEPFDLQEE